METTKSGSPALWTLFLYTKAMVGFFLFFSQIAGGNFFIRGRD